MTARAFGLGGLFLALLILGMVAVNRSGIPKTGQHATTGLCQDVSQFTQTMAEIRTGTISVQQAVVQLGQAQIAFGEDAQRERNPEVAPHIAALATDISDWRTSLITGDAVNEDTAVNRDLSELTSLLTC